MKKISVLFLFIVGFILINSAIEDIIRYKHFNTYSKGMYYKENIDYDVIFLGASSIHYAFSPLYLFHKYGLSSYNLAAAGCTYNCLYSIAEDAINTKKHKVLVIQYRILLSQQVLSELTKANIASINGYMSRFNAYYNICKANFRDALLDSSIYYLFHNRWKTLTHEDFGTSEYLRGYRSGTGQGELVYSKSDEKYVLSEEEKKQIDMFLNHFNEKIKIVFIATPGLNYHGDYSNSAINAFKEYTKKYNVDFIDLKNIPDFDLEKYMLDSAHIGYEGGKILMDREDFIPYIMKKYNLKDHRNDKKFAQWHKDYLKQERKINLEELKYSKKFNEWWKYANYNDYTIILSVKGENVLNRLPQNIKEKFSSKGLKQYETNKEKMNYVFVINNNKVHFESASEGNVMFGENIENILDLTLYSAGNAGIMISNEYVGINKYGLNFVVYDKIKREVVDSMWVDPEDFSKVNR